MKILISENVLLEGYSQKVINDLIEKFKKEKPSLTSNIIVAYINRFAQLKSSPKITEKDIYKYSWKDFERIIDLNQQRTVKTGIKIYKSEYIYDKNNLKILVGNTKRACVKYGNGYNFCISARGDDNMYGEYRYGENFTPYFVIDEDRTKERNKDGTFKDPLHLLIIMVRKHEDGKDFFYEYQLTTANNDGEKSFYYWSQITKIQPKLSGLGKIFVSRKGDKKEKKEYNIKIKYQKKLDDLNIKYDDKDVNYMIYFLEKAFLKIIDGLINNELKIFKYHASDKDGGKLTQKVAEKEPSIERWLKNLGVPLIDVSFKQMKKGLDEDEYLKKVKKIILSYFNELNKFKLMNAE